MRTFFRRARAAMGFGALLIAIACGNTVVIETGAGSAGTGSAGTGGAPVGVGDTTSSGAAGGAPVLACGSKQANLVGNIEGQAVSAASPKGGGFATYPPKADDPSIGMSLGDGGLVFVSGNTAGSSFKSPAIWVRMPAGAPNGGAWLCDMQGETISVTGSPTPTTKFTLHALRRLGNCPAIPVSGQLGYCDNPSASCSLGALDGSINGAPFHADLGGGILGPSNEFGDLLSGGMLALELAPQKQGALLTPLAFSDPSALYCVGSVSPNPGKATVLSELSRLGSCAEAPAVSGELTLCLGF